MCGSKPSRPPRSRKSAYGGMKNSLEAPGNVVPITNGPKATPPVAERRPFRGNVQATFFTTGDTKFDRRRRAVNVPFGRYSGYAMPRLQRFPLVCPAVAGVA